jgi:hypothetical protein
MDYLRDVVGLQDVAVAADFDLWVVGTPEAEIDSFVVADIDSFVVDIVA